MATVTNANKDRIINNRHPTIPEPTPTLKAVTIVEQGPRDDQARVDGYGGHVGPLKTQFTTALDRYSDDFFAGYQGLSTALGFKPVDLKNLSGLNKITAVLKELNPTKLLNRFENNVLGGRSLKSILNLPKEFKRDAIGTLEKYTRNANISGLNIGQMIRTGKMTYDEATKIYKAVKNNDWSSLEGIRKGLDVLGNTALSNLTKGVIDLHATSAFIGEAIRLAADLGDNDLVKEIRRLFGHGNAKGVRLDQQLINSLLGLSVHNAAARSDLSMLDSIIDIMGKETIRHNYPKLIKDTLQNFNLEPFYTPHMIKEYKQRLLSLLTKLDPNWDKETFNGIKVTKLEPFHYLSKDARTVLSYIDDEDEHDYTAEVMLAKDYPPMYRRHLVEKYYNDVVIRDKANNTFKRS